MYVWAFVVYLYVRIYTYMCLHVIYVCMYVYTDYVCMYGVCVCVCVYTRYSMEVMIMGCLFIPHM